MTRNTGPYFKVQVFLMQCMEIVVSAKEESLINIYILTKVEVLGIMTFLPNLIWT
jgi:hypothetical protein